MAQRNNQQQQHAAGGRNAGGASGGGGGLASNAHVQNIRGKMDAHLASLEQWIDRSPPANRYLGMASSKTGLKKSYILLAAVGFMCLYLAFGPVAGFVCNLIGFVYPAYASIKAIESHNKEDDTKWLTYWVVFAFMSIVEYFSATLLGWVPFYWLVKCLVLVWLFSPNENNGSLFVYYKFIRPFALKYIERGERMASGGGNNPNARGAGSSGGAYRGGAGGPSGGGNVSPSGQTYPNEDIGFKSQ